MRVIGKFLLIVIVILLLLQGVYAVCEPPCDSDEFCEYGVVCAVNPDCTCGPNHGGDNCGSTATCNGCTCEADPCQGTWFDCGSPGSCHQCGSTQYCTASNTCATLSCPGAPIPYQGECCTPATCGANSCGTIAQGCGLGNTDCGVCDEGYDCSVNTCICDPDNPEWHDQYCTVPGNECGDYTVCGVTRSCGSCDTGETCNNGVCSNDCDNDPGEVCEGKTNGYKFCDNNVLTQCEEVTTGCLVATAIEDCTNNPKFNLCSEEVSPVKCVECIRAVPLITTSQVSGSRVFERCQSGATH